MIIDTIENLHRYFPLDRRFKKIPEILKSAGTLEDGKYPLSGDMYLLIQVRAAACLEDGKFETHKEYIDLQVILEGEEMMSCAQTCDLTETQGYDPEKDIAFFKGEDNPVRIKKGMFYVMYPGEAHKCCCHREAGLPLKKAVFKIKA